MVSFNNIIGHEEIIGHLQNAIEDRKNIPFIYFYRQNQDLAKSFLQRLMR